MSNDDFDQDPLSSVLQSRRIPHAKSRNNNRGGKGSGRTVFNPLRAVGVYEIKTGSGKVKKQSSDKAMESPSSTLTIHGLTTDETGLLASFDINGVVKGMGILAGSRKGVANIVSELEYEESEDEDENKEEDDVAAEEVAGLKDDANDADDDDDEEEEEDEEEVESESAMEAEDARINRRARAFEKNSFRNPKFWIRWRGYVKNGDSQEVSETNTGYAVFSGNDCTTFDGTMTSEELGWDNMKIKGHKLKSHASECSWDWKDFS